MIAAVLCAWTGIQAGSIRLVPGINSPHNDAGAVLTRDSLSVYFCSNRPGGLGGDDLYMSRRVSVDAPWQTPANLRELNSPQSEIEPALRKDGLEIFFASSRPPGKDLHIWRSVRADLSSPWTHPVEAKELNSAVQESGPALTEDGLQIYFHSRRPGGLGDADIYTASRRDLASPFSAPVRLPQINSPKNELVPFPSADGLVLLFASNRSKQPADRDIWYSVRADSRLPWPEPVSLACVNTGKREYDPFLSADGRLLLFDAQRPDGKGGLDIWMLEDPPIIYPPVNVGALNTSREDRDVTQSSDTLSVVFSSMRSGDYDQLYTSRRAYVGSDWELATVIPELVSGARDGEPCMRLDGLELFFESRRKEGRGSFDIWRTTRLDLRSRWSKPVCEPFCTTDEEAGPAISPDGLTLFFHSTRPGGKGKTDIYYVTRSDLTSPFSNPQNLVEVNTQYNEYTPHLASDGLVLLFASDRPGGMGNLDIWCSIRSKKDAPWSEPVNFGPANSPFRDYRPYLSVDGRELFFNSVRPGGKGAGDIWVLRNPRIDLAGEK